MARLFFPLLAVLPLLLHSCISTEQAAVKRYTVKGGAIPDGYCSEGETLLILKKPDKEYNDAFKMAVDELYKGKVRYVSDALVKSLNTSTYRYLLDSEVTRYTEWYRDPRTGISDLRVYYLYTFKLTDRRRRKDYSTDYRSGDYYTLMRAYLRNLESERLANSQ